MQADGLGMIARHIGKAALYQQVAQFRSSSIDVIRILAEWASSRVGNRSYKSWCIQ